MAPPTFLLIHGGGTTARFWDRLLEVLDRPALAVDLPGRPGRPGPRCGLEVADQEAAVCDDVEAAGLDELIVVAHSRGGLVVPGLVAALGPRVTHIVLNAASVPPPGGCGLDCMRQDHRRRVLQALDTPPAAGGAVGAARGAVDLDAMRHVFGGEPLDDDTARYLADPVRDVVDELTVFRSPVDWSGVRDVPVTYLRTSQDRVVPPALQDEMIANLPAGLDVSVVTIDDGHVPAVTRPARFARILCQIADSDR